MKKTAKSRNPHARALSQRLHHQRIENSRKTYTRKVKHKTENKDDAN